MRSGLIFDDRYRLDERIAAGGVGQVWQATDLLLARPVAVKVLRPEYADHPETLDRFQQEARLAGALSHPRIAQVYDYGPAGPGGPPYLVLELVSGPSLAEVVDGQPVDPAFALDVVAQAADGLSAAHRAGLVHRDVKPANILIGAEGRVKVTDFGIAHAIGQAPVTTPGLVMGTTQYMAPERIAGGPGTPASDLYALGIVLHECLTGAAPYAGAPADVMAAHLYLPLPALPVGTPPEVGALVAQLTAKDPARRISDAHELAGIASRLRDAVEAGQLVPAPGTAVAGAVQGPVPVAPSGPAPAQPTTRLPGPGYAPASTTALAAAAPLDFGGGSFPDAATGVTGTSLTSTGLTSTGDGPPDGHGFAPFAALTPGDYPRHRVGAMTAGALLVLGAGLAAVLVTGALGSAPAADRSPAGPTGTSSTGARPAPSRSPASSGPADGGPVSSGTPAPTGGTPTPAARPRPSGPAVGTKKASPTASPSASTKGTASPTPAPRGGSPTGQPSGTPSSSPSGTPSPSPSMSPSASPTPTPLLCVDGLCL